MEKIKIKPVKKQKVKKVDEKARTKRMSQENMSLILRFE